MFERWPKLIGDGGFEFRPITDIVRENGGLVVTAELPGIDPAKDVEILVESDMLVIKGEKAAEKTVEEKDRYLHERHFGSFERRLPLPDGVDPEAITATYDKGVLTVRVPMPAQATSAARTIPIKVG